MDRDPTEGGEGENGGGGGEMGRELGGRGNGGKGKWGGEGKWGKEAKEGGGGGDVHIFDHPNPMPQIQLDQVLLF